MSNLERALFALCIFAGGIAAGMAIEHQRFIREVQGLSRKHAEPVKEPPPPVPSPTPEAA